MKRRDFLKIAAVAPVAAATTGFTYRRTQPHVGYLKAGAWVDTTWVEKVTVDGREVKQVFELDDTEGWLRRYADTQDPRSEELAVERLEGEIEVWWKRPTGATT